MAEPVRIHGGNIGGKNNEGKQAQVNDHGALFTTLGNVNESNKVYEDTSFVVGDSPAVHNFESDMGRTAVDGYIVCDGAGNIQVDISRNGLTYDEKFTMKIGEICELDGLVISKIRITHTGTDSAYRINLI